MSTSIPSFEYPPSLDEYTITEQEFLKRNPQYALLVTGAAVFNSDGKLLLVQRAADEKAFPNVWEIPGGKVDDTDRSILHAVARELKEETGLEVTKIVRKVGEVTWTKGFKIIFEVEVKDLHVVLDPIEHQHYVFATEEEVINDKTADIDLKWMSPPNKAINVEAFKVRREKALF